MVLDGELTLATLLPLPDESGPANAPAQQQFLEALPLHRQARTNLYALYQNGSTLWAPGKRSQ